MTHLDLSHNDVGTNGARRLAGVLAQYPALPHLNLSANQIGATGAGRLAEVLVKCTALAALDLRKNDIGHEGAGNSCLAGVLAQCPIWFTSISDWTGMESTQWSKLASAF
jgi:Ran GTPase-activating protein (RanGAP) involved in mRNA processing and transport